MNSKLNHLWIPVGKIEEFVQFEPALVILGLSLCSWLIYKLLLRGVSEDRHRRFAELFRNLFGHLLFGTTLFAIYYGMTQWMDESVDAERIASYIGLATIFWGAILFVKVWRVLAFEYLFLSHMRVGVPVLLVNIFSLILSAILGTWILSELFNIKLGPLMATSAALSVVLGLALQDTLGNLFAGIALQIDKPYELGDWIEAQNGLNKWAGQVLEVSWRATIMLGYGEEIISVPNRMIGSAQISNFSARLRPFCRVLFYKFGAMTDLEAVRKVILDHAKSKHVRTTPAPLALVSETTDATFTIKLVYYIEQYGNQGYAADDVNTAVIHALKAQGFEVSTPRIEIVHERADAAQA